MEDELDQIYNNFISRGTFELPLSSKLGHGSCCEILNSQFVTFLAQKSPTKKKTVIHLQDAEESESDDDETDRGKCKLINESI